MSRLPHEDQLSLDHAFAERNDLNLQYFSAAQLCRASGLSRTMLIKLEREGIVIPHHVNPETGYRWYDLFDVSRLQQYQLLRSMRLSLQEIHDYLGMGRLQPEDILARLRERLRILQSGVDAYALRLSKENNLKCDVITLPDVTCYCCTDTFDSQAEVVKVGFEAHTETVRRGYRLMSTVPLFSIRLSGRDAPFTAKICIPLDSEARDYAGEQDVEVISGGRFFSMLYYGGYEKSDRLCQALQFFWERLRAENLTPVGPMRVFWIVSCYVGTQFSKDDYVFRISVPIE